MKSTRTIQKRLLALFMAVVMLLSVAVTPAMAETKQEPPQTFSASSNWGSDFTLDFGYTATAWSDKITAVTVNGENWSKVTSSYSINKNTAYYVSSSAMIYIGEGFSGEEATCVIQADGYNDLTLTLNKTKHTATVVENSADTYSATVDSSIVNGKLVLSKSTGLKAGDEVSITSTTDQGYEQESLSVSTASGKTVDVKNNSFLMPAENVTVSATYKLLAAKTLDLSQVNIAKESFGNNWILSFTNADGYVSNIQALTVNGTAWSETAYGPYYGGQYKKNAADNYLSFAGNDNSGSQDKPALKSGDAITISAKGYNDLSFKLLIDVNGNASLAADDGQGDTLQLHVKLEGSFEAAIVGQKDYDGVSGASTGGTSSNKNSAVTVYGALVDKGTEPADSDWEELDHLSKINLNGKNCSVSIVADTSKGTDASADSGMKGVYMTSSSDLSLDGTPKDAGSYLISVSIEDNQGRRASSNALPFRIYTGEETLADQLVTDNLKQYASGLYAWDIMEPWAIKNFGSNVAGEENSVRVPEKLEVWFGSHTSGTYGILGYDIAWADVQAGKIPQTLYIPAGCDLTLTNMKILSSVRIVVENGGKLTLSDSTVQGIIDVQSGGTFSMNYDAFNKQFTSGASICGQLRLEDGSILENAAIYSHTNYLANGDLVDRSNDAAVVSTSGDVTIKGQVFISGDEAGSTGKGQTALAVNEGTLTLEDGAVLATYGGGGNVMLYASGGSAIELNNGTIEGQGKLIALGGSVLFGSGDSAVAGKGNIDVSEAFIQGATAYDHKKGAVPGKAHDSAVKIKATKKHVADGTMVDGAANDPLADLYWKASIEVTPDLSKYEINENENQNYDQNQIQSDSYTVTVINPEHGQISTSNENAKKGESVTITSSPDAGYELDSVAAEENGSKSLQLSEEGDGKYSFTMPAGNVTVTASFAQKDSDLSFADVSSADYYFDAVQWALQNGITTGKTATIFAPAASCTRAEIVTFLWRAAGKPEVDEQLIFADVSEDAYYAKAVAWAVAKGITNGTSADEFEPNAICTRAQAVTFLWRAASAPSVSGTAEFSDVAAEAYYATAVKWAQEKGITGGIGDGLFAPDQDCSRAQITTFLYRANQDI